MTHANIELDRRRLLDGGEPNDVKGPGDAVKDISTPWEGEGPAEPHASIGRRKTMRLGGSLALPSTRITNWGVLVQ